MNFSLAIGATSTEVTVAAQAPLLESETSSLGQVIQEKTVTDLPLNGRSFIQLATLTAGTLPSTRTSERDNFISNGARAVQNSYLLDGIDNKNRILGFDNNSAQIPFSRSSMASRSSKSRRRRFRLSSASRPAEWST